ncbi:MAG TPA: aldehyde dehydrogenase family protein [Frankiaceae bacterium]|jgi:aldehyde dehydrogenase (NAD+)|nr:aldehyde dehydrogenase family protein [Frankiaceae bacterium]
MSVTADPAARPSVAATSFDSLNPATNEVLASYPIHDQVAVDAAVSRAREAAQWWADLGFDGRRSRLGAWRRVLARRAEELAALMTRENGKPKADAVLEIMLAVDHLAWAAKAASKVLGVRKVSSGILAANQASTVEYPPLGLIGVIGPWNYPVFTPMGSIAYAMAAGNAVVFKPSEYTPGIGTWLADTFAEAVTGPPVLQVITGLGETGAALCRAKVDKVAFTGSAATGRKVMAACAQNLTPVLMECGGKDAMIVDDDADVSAAADAALWGGMSNAGQTCTGIERVYVTERNYEAFVRELTTQVRAVEAGTSYGPITMPGQLKIIERHVNEALDAGGRAIVGGRASIHPPYVDPVVLVDVPASASAMTEETFGPTLTVTKVRDGDEAVAQANATGYGLAGAVFGTARAMELARGMRTGMTSVNSVIAFATVPELPFGGVGESGFGRIHGADGLREFTRAKSITRQRFALPVTLTSFRRPAAATAVLLRALKAQHGR